MKLVTAPGSSLMQASPDSPEPRLASRPGCSRVLAIEANRAAPGEAAPGPRAVAACCCTWPCGTKPAGVQPAIAGRRHAIRGRNCAMRRSPLNGCTAPAEIAAVLSPRRQGCQRDDPSHTPATQPVRRKQATRRSMSSWSSRSSGRHPTCDHGHHSRPRCGRGRIAARLSVICPYKGPHLFRGEPLHAKPGGRSCEVDGLGVALVLRVIRIR